MTVEWSTQKMEKIKQNFSNKLNKLIDLLFLFVKIKGNEAYVLFYSKTSVNEFYR